MTERAATSPRPRWTSGRIRRATGTGSSPSRAAWPRWRWTSRRTAGLRPGYELKFNSYDLGVDIELADAVQRLRFEHPEVGAVIITSLKERVFCAGANIRMLSQSGARLEGELLQVHERDAQRDGRGERVVRSALPHRRERTLCRRRLRARPGDRLDRHGRRREHGRVPSGGPAPGRASRHRRTHAPDRQAPRPAGPGGRVLHARGGHQGPAGAGVGAGRRGRPALQARRRRPRARGSAGRAERPTRGGAGNRASTTRPNNRGGPDRLRPPDVCDRSRRVASRRSPWRGRTSRLRAI